MTEEIHVMSITNILYGIGRKTNIRDSDSVSDSDWLMKEGNWQYR